MGVVLGEISFFDNNFGYKEIKEFWYNNNVELASDYPKQKLISTMSTDKLKIFSEDGIEIKGDGNQITGMDNDKFEISISGIPYLIYKTDFPNLLKDYENRFNES